MWPFRRALEGARLRLSSKRQELTVPVKDKVGEPGSPLNARSTHYYKLNANTVIAVDQKDGPLSNADLRTAIGASTTPPASGEDVIYLSEKEAVQKAGLIGVRVQYEQETAGGTLTRTWAKLCASPTVASDFSALKAALLSAKYWGTLTIVKVQSGY